MASATFPPALGGDGSTVTDDANATTGLANGGHRARFVPALAQTVAVMNGGVAAAQTQVALATAQVALATTQANNSATSAANAAMSAGATVWVSGTTYAIGDTRYSPITNQIYRRKTAGAGTTDPSSDSTNWALVMLDAVTNYPTSKPSLNLDFTNTKTLDPRITFSRASTATFYDGKTLAKAEENLLSYSQEFDNAYWTKNNAVTITPNTGPYDPTGSNYADDFISTQTGLNSISRVYPFRAGIPVTISIHAYFGTKSYLQISIPSTVMGSSKRVNFYLQVGSVASIDSGLTASVVSAGSSLFKRYSVTFTPTLTATNSFHFVLMDGDGTYNQNSSPGNIYIWGAQLEERDSVTAYTTTTSQPITNYIPVLQTAAANTPRFDHNPTTGESLGLLIEEQRTNLLLQSQFATSWSTANSILLPNYTIAPDETLTAAKTYPVTPAGYGGGSTYQIISKSATATTYTFSVYAKLGEVNQVTLYVNDVATTSNRATVKFSLIDGSIVTSASAVGTFTAASASAGVGVGGGWYRFSLTFTSSTETSILARIYANDSVLTTANGYSGIYIWGAQLEAGSFPTSYIPTTTAQVTRSADAASMTGSNFSSWYRQDEGTIYYQMQFINQGTSRMISINDNSASNRLLIAYATGGFVQPVITADAALQAGNTQANAPSVTAPVKHATAYKLNDFAWVGNAGTVTTDTSGLVPVKVNQITIGSEVGIVPSTGHIKRIAFWPSRLSNTQLQALTT